MIEKITIKFLNGTYIENAIRKATEIAKYYDTEVEFDFNGTKYSGGKKLVEKQSFVLEFVDIKKEE